MTNKFGWYELSANDADAAIEFYTHVVGWTPMDFPGAEPRYTVLQIGDRGIGGVMAADPGTKPGWSGYIYTKDIDASIKGVVAAGGSLLFGPFDIPNVGPFAMLTDPQGAPFRLLSPTGPDEPPIAQYTPGNVDWNELHTTDWTAAIEFYTSQFGWTKDHVFEMGEMGGYQIFAVDGVQAGGMMNSPISPPAFWLPYFSVEDIDAAHTRATDRGATVMHGPAEVPGGGYILQATDPQGVMFALTGPRK